jgi:hypothetical protein
MQQRSYKTIQKVFKSLIIAITFCCWLTSYAQDSLITKPDFFRHSSSWALNRPHEGSILMLYQLTGIGTMGIHYKNENGSFRRPQEPSSINTFSFQASGVQQTSSLVFFGNFNYQVQRDEGQQWRNTAQPADDQPYIWADTSRGTWDRNHFNVQVKMVTHSKTRAVQGGIDFLYKGGAGDRQSTPKPLYRFHRLAISPSIIYKKGARQLALSFQYAQQSEDNEMGYYVNDRPLLYRLRGYGTFSRSPFVSATRLLSSTLLGGGIEYLKGKINDQYVRSVVSYAYTNGNIKEGIAVTTPAGEWNTHELSGKFNWGLRPGKAQWLTSIDFSMSRMSGKDPLFQAINYYLNKIKVGPALRYTKSDDCYAEIHAEYSHREEKDIVAATNATVHRADVGLAYFYRFSSSKHAKFFTLPRLSYSKPLDSNLLILSPTEISEAMVRPDFYILSQSYSQMGIQVGIDVKCKGNAVRVAVDAIHTQNAQLTRSQIGLVLNYLFL